MLPLCVCFFPSPDHFHHDACGLFSDTIFKYKQCGVFVFLALLHHLAALRRPSSVSGGEGRAR